MKAKTLEQVKAIVANVSFMDRTFRVLQKGDGFLLQLEYFEADINTGKVEKQRARKWYVSPFSTETEIVETAFKACRTSMEHVLKEHFLYDGARIYSPHFNVRARVMLAEQNDFDGRDYPTSLEVLPTDKTTIFEVFISGVLVGTLKNEPDMPFGPTGTWFGRCRLPEKTSQPFRTKTQAARWVLGTAAKGE